MRDYKAELEDTVRLLRKYIKSNRPQSFASLFPTFVKQIRRCEIYEIKTEKYTDIVQYAAIEKIERFGFNY